MKYKLSAALTHDSEYYCDSHEYVPIADRVTVALSVHFLKTYLR